MTGINMSQTIKELSRLMFNFTQLFGLKSSRCATEYKIQRQKKLIRQNTSFVKQEATCFGRYKVIIRPSLKQVVN